MAIDWNKEIDLDEAWKNFKKKFYSKRVVSRTIIGNNNVQSGNIQTDGDLRVYTKGNNTVTSIVGRKAVINGRTYKVNGGNLEVIDGIVYIDGEVAYSEEDKKASKASNRSYERNRRSHKRFQRSFIHKRAQRQLMIIIAQLIILFYFSAVCYSLKLLFLL